MYFVGVDVGGTNLAAGLVDRKGGVRSRVKRRTDCTMTDLQLCMELVSLAREAAEKGNAAPEEIEAVGFGIPGRVDAAGGTVLFTPNMPFRDTGLRDIFRREWDVPVFLNNDANCAAAGEYLAGAARGCRSVLMITLGTGIGGGFINEGRLYTGAHGSAMEIGHMVIETGGLPCGCGGRGCWEQYASATALIRLTREEMARDGSGLIRELCGGDPEKVTGRTAFEAARLGDPAARRVLDTYLCNLSAGLVSLIRILEPEVICLGGGVSGAEDDLLLDPLRRRLDTAFGGEMPAKLIKADLGGDAGIVGAALLCAGTAG